MRNLFLRVSLFIAIVMPLVSSMSALAQDDAKTLYQQSLSTGGDQCKSMELVCKAATLDSKKKEYRKGCDDIRASLEGSDRAALKTAHDALDDGGFPKAIRYAGYVCKADTKQAEEAQQIVRDAQKAQQAKSSPPPPQPQPTTPQKTEQAAVTQPPVVKPEEAKPAPVATNTPSKAPENSPVTQQPTSPTPTNVAKVTPPAAGQAKPQAGPKPPPEDPAVTAQRFLDEADRAKAAGKLQDALKSYEAALRAQPTNMAALTGKNAVQAIINSDPAEQAKTLAQAIRDFYAGKYSDTEDELSSYLSSTNVKSRGAAHFYLAAARLSRSLLEKSASQSRRDEISKLFKQSTGEQYKPVERYVSPLIMDAWRSANGGQ